jgi:preprotein translocase subunit SecE
LAEQLQIKEINVAVKSEKKKESRPNALQRWWGETVGEMRKVTWPTPQAAWKLTQVVLIVMFAMSLLLGLLDFVFAQLITLLLA